MMKPRFVLISEAILNINPKAEFISRNEYDQIEWLNGTEVIPEETIEEAILQLQNNSYQEARMFEYPTIHQQLDMQYHDLVNGTTTWLDAIQAVKDKYPKG